MAKWLLGLLAAAGWCLCVHGAAPAEELVLADNGQSA